MIEAPLFPPRGLELETVNVSFSYGARAAVLTDRYLKFEPGTITAITGPSGQGKSTLLYLLGLMLKPTSGDVVVDGKSTSQMADSACARLRAMNFGFVFQDAALDATRSVLENVTETALYRNQDRRVYFEAARSLLAELAVDVPSDRRPGQVSGGQAQRIALCRALLFSPAIVLADEPTGNLDPSSSTVVIDALVRHAHEGATVIVVTHSPDVARACDRVIRL